ncbi:uncharacterized protein UV8b_04940 [Ustilaginoidea virens]|uniref:Uncharacterized protein n=1 Tax=Ustilaginoidea virens TaxID=1159556 RepID=A0A8E5HT39_USTVR|nr:uncharacterized protein UV8b_04940 [Ustilaginoidea virens]QUC20699.1 hypothetical protein UV8b_04940 [Ustilaginoidea virens]
MGDAQSDLTLGHQDFVPPQQASRITTNHDESRPPLLIRSKTGMINAAAKSKRPNTMHITRPQDGSTVIGECPSSPNLGSDTCCSRVLLPGLHTQLLKNEASVWIFIL